MVLGKQRLRVHRGKRDERKEEIVSRAKFN